MYSYSIFNYNSKKIYLFYVGEFLSLGILFAFIGLNLWSNSVTFSNILMTLVVQVSVILTAEVESQFSTSKIWGVFLIKTSTSLKAGTIFEKLMKTHESN